MAMTYLMLAGMQVEVEGKLVIVMMPKMKESTGSPAK